MLREPLPAYVPDDAEQACHQAYPVTRWRQGERHADIATVAEEVPVALVYNGISHAVMLATPHDLEDFALGFSLAEGILQGRQEIYDMEVVPQCEGVEVQMTIASERMVALKEKRRSLTGRTGCGICGAESLSHAVRYPGPVQASGIVTDGAVHAAFAGLQARQSLHQVTGAVHAAGWAGLDGQVHLVREDVGRHNALDKLVGAMTRQGFDPAAGFVVVTSRASYEMVQKAASAGIFMLAAISAPTGLAIRLAEQSDLTLVGFARNGAHVVYAHPERLITGTMNHEN